MQVYKQIIKSTGIDFFTFYATTCAGKCNKQLVVATTGAFTLTSVNFENSQGKIRKIRLFKKLQAFCEENVLRYLLQLMAQFGILPSSKSHLSFVANNTSVAIFWFGFVV